MKMFRDTEGYIERKQQLNKALENYYQVDLPEHDFSGLEDLMMATFDLSSYIRANTDHTWLPRNYSLHVGNAIKDVVEVLNSGGGRTYAIPWEVNRLEALSRSIYEYIQRKTKHRARTM